jgi:hypothetical protein
MGFLKMSTAAGLVGCRLPMPVLALLVACAGLITGPSLAQSPPHGSISGVVTDARGKPIQYAAVELTDAATGARLATLTSASGTFRFDNLPQGTYDASVAKPSFAVTRIAAQRVFAGRALSLVVILRGSARLRRTQQVSVNP